MTVKSAGRPRHALRQFSGLGDNILMGIIYAFLVFILIVILIPIINIIASFAVRLPLIWYLSQQPEATLRTISLGLPSASLVQFLLGLAFLFFAKSEQEQRKQLRLR